MSGRRSGFVFQKGGRALLPWTALSNRGQESVPTEFLKNKTAQGEQGHPSQRLVFLVNMEGGLRCKERT